jgi:hypothetical protein
MKAPPFENESEGARVESASNASVGDSDLDVLSGIAGVEVGWEVLIVIHRYDDSIEATHPRHT